MLVKCRRVEGGGGSCVGLGVVVFVEGRRVGGVGLVV